MLRSAYVVTLLIFTFLNASCVVAIGKWKVSSYEENGKGNHRNISLGKTIDIDVQRQVAIHEAGHAIAMAILFGVDEVTKVVVNTYVDENGWLGHANWSSRVSNRYTLDLNRKSAAVSLAARSADTIINGAPVSGSSTDLKSANDKMVYSYISWGLGGSPIVYASRHDAPKWMQKKIEEDILDAEKYADAIILANIDTVKALADDIMSIAPINGSRVMEEDVFKAFCSSHSLVDPREEISAKKSE